MSRHKVHLTNDVDDGIKEFTCGYHICYKISLVLILGGYLKVREYLYTQVVMNYIDTVRVCLPSFEGSCMVHWSICYPRQKNSHMSISY